jgi:hypothetical protein
MDLEDVRLEQDMTMVGVENLEVNLPQFCIESIDRLVDFALDVRGISSMSVHNFLGHVDRLLDSGKIEEAVCVDGTTILLQT